MTERAPATADDLHAAVTGLLEPQRRRLFRDDGTIWVIVPSLWAQLSAAVATGAEAVNGGAFKSRPPAAIEILDLRAEIIDVVANALAGYDVRPRGNLPESLRLLAAELTRAAATDDGDLLDWWEYRVTSWSRRIRRALGLDSDPQPRRIRDTPCPACGATHVQATVDGETQRVPALLIDFQDQRVRAAQCGACGRAWWRGDDLHNLGHMLGTCQCDTPNDPADTEPVLDQVQ